MDPCFKGKLDCVADAAWGWLEKAANVTVQCATFFVESLDGH